MGFAFISFGVLSDDAIMGLKNNLINFPFYLSVLHTASL